MIGWVSLFKMLKAEDVFPLVIKQIYITAEKFIWVSQ